jgi:DNA-binding transcriptional ArsR family regulator
MEKVQVGGSLNRSCTLVDVISGDVRDDDRRRERRAATVAEAKAAAHPLRLRILRLCGQQELTNRQLADRLDRDPGTVLYHVRQLVAAGLLEQGEVRAGSSGALEKPYRSTGLSWWLSMEDTDVAGSLAPVEAFAEELREAGPDAITEMSRFVLHLSQHDVATLGGRIQEILDEYVRTDGERANLPSHGGIFVLHRLAD